MKKALFVLFISIYTICSACTSAIISGKATIDGRPILWKHRDSDADHNKLMYFTGEKYDFIGIVNSTDLNGKEVWMGSNSAGFSIINTASYNVNCGKKCELPEDQEGIYMKMALSKCETVDDFENLLKSTTGKYGIAANFGVIDAKGGAAYFETGFNRYSKFDVNDPKIAPLGYLVRTNFSFTGNKEDGKGYFRFQSAEELLYSEYLKGKLSVEFILQKGSRCLKHSVTKTDLYKSQLPADSNDITYVPFRDYILRSSTVSAMVIQGVKPGEDPRFTTLWTILGSPLTTMVSPVWVGEKDLPRILVTKGKEFNPALNSKSLFLKSKCFPIAIENGIDYINLSFVLNQKNNGVLQKLLPAEKVVINKTLELQNKLYSSGFSNTSINEYYKWLEKYITEFYQKEYGI